MRGKFKLLYPTYELRITLLSYLSNFLSGILMIKLFTQMMNPDDYGKLGLVSSLSSLFITTIISPFMQGASRYFIQTNPLLSFKYVEKALKKIEYVISIITFIIALYFFFNEDFLNLSISFLLLFTLLLDSRGQWNTSFLHLKRRRFEYTVSTSLFNWLKIIISIYFLYLFPQFPGVAFILIAWIISSFVSNKYSTNKINESFSDSEINNENEFSSLDLQSLKSFIFNFFILNVFLWIQGWADKWILNYVFEQSEALGVYISFNQVAMIPFVALNGLIIMYYGPIIYQNLAQLNSVNDLQNIKIKVNSLKKYFIVFSFLSLLLLIVIAPFLLKTLITNYKIDVTLFTFAAFSSLLFNYSQIQAFSIQCTGKLKNLLLPNILVGVLIIVVNLLFAKQNGVYGALIIINIMMLLKIILLSFYEKKSWIEFINMNSNIIK